MVQNRFRPHFEVLGGVSVGESSPNERFELLEEETAYCPEQRSSCKVENEKMNRPLLDRRVATK